MSGFIHQVFWILLVIQVLASLCNADIATANLSDLTTEVDITIQHRETDHTTDAHPTQTIPTGTNRHHHTPEKKASSPDTSLIETQLTEAVTQPNPAATESTTDSLLNVETDASTVELGTSNDRTRETNTHGATTESQKHSTDSTTLTQNEHTRTKNVQSESRTSFRNAAPVVLSTESKETDVVTQTDAVITLEQTTRSDVQGHTEYLTQGTDPVSNGAGQLAQGKDTEEETTERGSVEVLDRTDVVTTLEDTTPGRTDEALVSNRYSPAFREEAEVSSTSLRGVPTDGVTSPDADIVIGEGTDVATLPDGVIGDATNVVTSPDGDIATGDGTDVVTSPDGDIATGTEYVITEVVTATETPGVKEGDVTTSSGGDGTERNDTYPDAVMTTAMPATTSPYSTIPCIQENPTMTETTLDVCLCKPVEGATHYVAIADTVEGSGFFLRAYQNETDMEDDFDMADDSREADKEVQWGQYQEHHNATVMSEGASLCAHFTKLTAGRQYNVTVQALQSPGLPPQSISLPMVAETRAARPVLRQPIVKYSRVRLRWYFKNPMIVRHYNISYRWDDQIGFAATNLPGSQLQWDIYGLMSGATYVFRVKVKTPWRSSFSEITRTMKLYQPRAFVQHQSPTSVDLAWVYDDDTFVEHYTIKYTLVNTNETKVVLLPGNWLVSNNFNVSGLTSGGTYRFELIAESGPRAKAAEICMQTELLAPALNFSYTNGTSLGVNWAFAAPVIFEYYNFSYTLVPNKDALSPSYGEIGRIDTILPLWQKGLNLTDLIPGARYNLQLQAVGEFQSSMVQEFKGTNPESPTGLKVLHYDDSSIELGWNQTFIDHVEHFLIKFRSGRTGNVREVESLGPVKRLNRLRPGDNYKIWVRTLSWGEESKAAFIEQRTKLRGPMTVTAIAYTDTSVTIRWHIPQANVVTDWTFWCEGPGCDLESPDTYIYLKSRQTHGKHTFIGLTSGEKYQFVVNVWSDLENLEGSMYQSTAPERPVNLHVTDYSATSISISWEAPKNSTVQEYLVTYQGMMETVTNNNSFSFVTPLLRANIRNLFPGDFYVIKVQSVTQGAKSTPVEEVQNTKLSQVTGVKSHSITNNSFILEWVGAEGYFDNVRVQCSNCSYTQVYRSVPRTSNRIMFTNLKSGGMYVVKLVTMRNGFMDSEPVAFQASTYPDSPSKLHIVSLSDRQITLQWNGTPCTGCNVDFFYIDKVSDDGEALHNDGVSCAESADTQEKVCTKTFLNLHPGHMYTFTVTAVSFGLQSQRPFVYRQRTKPGIPGDITFNLIDKWRIIVSWLPAEGTVDSYIINIRSGQGNVDESREVPYNRRRLDFTRLRPGRPYTISIIANVAGLVSNQRSIVVHTLPDIPSRVHNFRVKAISPVEVLATYLEPKQPNGIIEAYHISYYGSSSKGKPCPSVLDRKLAGSSSKAVIKDLYAGCNYTFSIAASTGAGKGHPVTRYVRTPIGAPKATGRQPGVPASNAINRHSFTVTFDTTFFDEAYGDIGSYAILVAEATTITSHKVDSKNSTITPVMMTWAQALEYDIIPRYQINQPYHYAELFQGDTNYSRRKREAVFSRDITIGKEECSTAAKTDFCNGPLKAERTYVYQFRGFSDNGYSDTEFSPPIHLPSDQTGLIVGISVVLAVLFIIVLILAVMVVGRKWKYVPYRGKYMLANTSEPLTGTMSPKGSRASKIKFSRPILLTGFFEDYLTMNAHSHYGFSQEYEAIRKVGKKLNCNAAVLADNVSKNRYTNILPYDKTRVKLSQIDDDEGSDYVNANYIPGFTSPREFIACQGPLPGTTNDMWKMIWEHNVATIVMVTQLVEKAKVKCDQYWPEDHKPVLYGDIQVTMTSSTEHQDWNVREFSLQKAENVKKVRHINYLSWPDHGVPESSDTLLGFIRYVRSQMPKSSTPNCTPAVVHCSAGVGRTGTFICLDRILHHIEEFDYVDIMGFVAEMRTHRNYMVQTEQQYVFIHRCVLDILREKGIAPKDTPNINGDVPENGSKGSKV